MNLSSNSFYSLLALLIALICVGFLPFFAAVQNTEFDGCLVPGRGLLAQNYITNNISLCLNPSKRAITSLQSPLYPLPLVMGTFGGSQITVRVNFLAKILIEEMMGYRVLLYDNAAASYPYFPTAFTTPNLNCLPHPGIADFAASTGYSQSNPNYKSEYNTLVPSTLANLGSLSVESFSSFFIDHKILSSHPQHSLNIWTSYTKGTPFYSGFPSFYYPYSPERDAFVTAAINVTRVNAWNFVSTVFPNWDSDFFLGPSCPPDNIFSLESGGLYAGCNDGRFPNMFCPSACFPNPTEQCTVWLAYPPILGSNFRASLVQYMNLSVCIAYVDYEYFLNPDVWTDTYYPGMVISSASDLPIGQTLCENGITCYQPVTLPRYDETCDLFFNGSVTSPYLCELQPHVSLKLARNDLLTRAPRVYHFLQRMDINTIQSMEMNQYSGCLDGDERCRACQWINQNEDIWTPWIDPPAACIVDDYDVFVSDCNEQTSQKTASYFWRLPKACQGGVSLPISQTFSCGYFSSSNQSTFPALISLGSIVFAALALYHLGSFVLCRLNIGLRRDLQEHTWFSAWNSEKIEHMWFLGLCAVFVCLVLLISSPLNSTGLCAAAVSCWWFGVQIVLISVINHGLWKLVSTVQDFPIVPWTWRHYMSTAHAPVCGIVSLILYLTNSGNLISQSSFLLDGGYTASFSFCNLPDLWIQWCLFIFLLFAWIPMIVIFITFFVFDLHPLVVAANLKINNSSNKIDGRKPQARSSSVTKQPPSQQQEQQDHDNSKQTRQLRAFFVIFHRLGAQALLLLVAQITVLSSFYASQVFENPNNVQLQRLTWSLVAFLLMTGLFVSTFAKSKSFKILFAYLFCFPSSKYWTSKYKKNQKKQRVMSKLNKIVNYDEDAERIKAERQIVLSVQEEDRDHDKNNNNNSNPSTTTASIHHSLSPKRVTIDQKSHRSSSHSGGSMDIKMPDSDRKLLQTLAAEMRGLSKLFFIPEVDLIQLYLSIEQLMKKDSGGVDSSTVIPLNNTNTLNSLAPSSLSLEVSTFNPAFPFNDLDDKMAEFSTERSTSSQSRGSKQRSRNVHGEDSDNEHSSNHSSNLFGVVNVGHFATLAHILSHPIKLAFLLKWSALSHNQNSEMFTFLLEMKRLHFVLFSIPNLNATELEGNLYAVARHFIGSGAKMELNLSGTDVTNFYKPFNAQIDFLKSNQSAVVTLNTRLNVWNCFAKVIKEILDLINKNNLVDSFRKSKTAADCVDCLRVIKLLPENHFLSQALVVVANRSSAGEKPNNTESSTPTDAQILSYFISQKQQHQHQQHHTV